MGPTTGQETAAARQGQSKRACAAFPFAIGYARADLLTSIRAYH